MKTIIAKNYKGYRIEQHSDGEETEYNAYGIEGVKVGEFEGYATPSELKLTLDLEAENENSNFMKTHFFIGGIA